MVKRSMAGADADADVSKTITTSAVNGTGQISDDGTSDGGGELLFQIRAAHSPTS